MPIEIKNFFVVYDNEVGWAANNIAAGYPYCEAGMVDPNLNVPMMNHLKVLEEYWALLLQPRLPPPDSGDDLGKPRYKTIIPAVLQPGDLPEAIIQKLPTALVAVATEEMSEEEVCDHCANKDSFRAMLLDPKYRPLPNLHCPTLYWTHNMSISKELEVRIVTKQNGRMVKDTEGSSPWLTSPPGILSPYICGGGLSVTTKKRKR